MSTEDVERIKQEHEDVVVEEVRKATPHVDVKEIRRLVREHSDGNKVLEILTGEPTNDIENQNPLEPATESQPNGTAEDNDQQIVGDTGLTASMEILSINTPAAVNKEPTISPSPPLLTEMDNIKSRARQRREVSTARKQKQAKREQKEAAKRRKRIEALGLDTAQEKDSDRVQEHTLKAIVI
jgi:regulator of protease activity HflC (stomatin/prohibitin superfamily)